jgi:hypothetical protein
VTIPADIHEWASLLLHTEAESNSTTRSRAASNLLRGDRSATVE